MTKLKYFWERWLLCTRTCPGMHPYCPRTAPALHTQWNKKNPPCGGLRTGHYWDTKYFRSLPGQQECIARQSLRATLVCCPVIMVMAPQQWWKGSSTAAQTSRASRAVLPGSPGNQTFHPCVPHGWHCRPQAQRGIWNCQTP